MKTRVLTVFSIALFGIFLSGLQADPSLSPSNLVRTSYQAEPRQIGLSWQDTSSNETGFRVEWSADAGQTWTTFGEVAADITSFSGALPTTDFYYFRVLSLGTTGNSQASNVISVEGTGPSLADTDGDGMVDGFEWTHDLDVYALDAFEDADGDRFPNLFEFVKATNPQDSQSVPDPDWIVDPAHSPGGIYVTTIQAALNSVTSDHEIIQIEPGVYEGTGNTNLVFPTTHPVLLMSVAGAAETILDGGGTTRGLQVSTGSVIDGLTIRHCAAEQGAAIQIGGGAPLFINLVLLENVAVGQGSAISQLAGSGTLVHGTLKNNSTTTGSVLAVIGGTFAVDKSIFWNPASDSEILESQGASAVVSESLIRGGFPGVGNVALDPLLRTDGHLLAGSPVIDLGGVLETALEDMDGEARPAGTTTDVGADEWLDTDGDDLGDWWEIRFFQNLSQVAAGDPDDDGSGNLLEYQSGSLPKDFYSRPNGQGGEFVLTPGISALSGNSQIGSPGDFLSEPLRVSLSWNGSPLANAPVAFSVDQGGLAVVAVGAGSPSQEVKTDSNGEASVWLKLPTAEGISTVLAKAGAAQTSFQATSAVAPEAPTLSVPAGRYVTRRQVVITTPTAGASIRYTLDGSDPTAASSVLSNGGTVTVSATSVLKAKAILPNGRMSSVSEAAYQITGMVAPGEVHTTFLKSDGTVWTVGMNWFWQMGINSQSDFRAPTNLGLSNVAAISSGDRHTLFLLGNGTLLACGNNVNGQVGDGTTTIRKTPVPVSGLTGVIAISTGRIHSIALKSDGTVWAWGRNAEGQLGDGTTTQRKSPVQVSGLTNIVAVSAGDGHSMALRADGTVWTWGANNLGQLGDGTTTTRLTPVQVTSLSNVSSIGAGRQHSTAVKTDGTVRAWGYNVSGQLGDGTTTNRTTPVAVSGLTGIVEISCGKLFSLARKNDGSVWAWGNNDESQLGDGSHTIKSVPAAIVGISGAVRIATGVAYSFIISEDGTIHSFGRNLEYQLGAGSIANLQAPGQVHGISGAVEVQANMYHSLGLRADGTVLAWGQNWFGEIGDGSIEYRNTPVVVSGIQNSISVAVGYYHSVSAGADGIVRAWGYNSQGQLGDGTNLDRLTPVNTVTMTNATAVAAGAYHSVGLKADGTVWTWGRNTEGQLGDGTTTQRKSPVNVGGLSDVIAIAAGAYHSVALKADGTLWAWGMNQNGQLGDGTTQNRTSPVRVGTLTGITAISTTWYHNLALQENGTAWAWGANASGQLGDGTTVGRTSPVQVSGINSIVAVAAGDACSLVIKKDGTLWELRATPPTQIGTSQDFVGISAATSHKLALRSNATVWAWGDNYDAQMGIVLPARSQAIIRLTPNSSDANQNGMADTIELQVFGNTTTDLSQDPDADGLVNAREIALGTNPLQANSDGDIYLDSADPAPLSASSDPAPVAAVFAGNNQRGLPGTLLPDSLEVAVTLGGQPMKGMPVIAALNGNGTISSVSETPTVSTGKLLRTSYLGRTGVRLMLPATVGSTSVSFVTAPQPITFQATSTFDVDGDGMLDAWEIENFGNTNQPANGDPDGDGQTNLQEFQNTTNPNDYYNGVLPQLTIVGSHLRNGPSDQILASPLVVSVSGSNGLLLNAPVIFEIVGGVGMFSPDITGATTSASLSVRTVSPEGQASAYLIPSGNPGDVVTVQARVTVGGQSVTANFEATISPLVTEAPKARFSGNYSLMTGQVGSEMSFELDENHLQGVARARLFVGGLEVSTSQTSPFTTVWTPTQPGRTTVVVRVYADVNDDERFTADARTVQVNPVSINENEAHSPAGGGTAVALTQASDTIASLPFHKPAVFAGKIASVVANEITVAGSSPLQPGRFASGNQTYVLQILSGAMEGREYQISGNTNSALVVQGITAQTIPEANSRFLIRPVWTANEALPQSTFESPSIPPVLKFPDRNGNWATAPYSRTFTWSANGWLESGLPANSQMPDSWFMVQNESASSPVWTTLGDVPHASVVQIVGNEGPEYFDTPIVIPRPGVFSPQESGLLSGEVIKDSAESGEPEDCLLLFSQRSGLIDRSPNRLLYRLNGRLVELGQENAPADLSQSSILDGLSGVILRRSGIPANWVNHAPHSTP